MGTGGYWSVQVGTSGYWWVLAGTGYVVGRVRGPQNESKTTYLFVSA